MDDEALAQAIHEHYRELTRREGWAAPYDAEYEELTDTIKAANIAAAERIPRVLALVGLAVVDKGHPASLTRAEVDRIIEECLEVLAEGEHVGWSEQKRMDGWSYAPERDDSAKKHPCLVDYARLGEDEKAKDRSSVRHYPDIVELAGRKIVRARDA